MTLNNTKVKKKKLMNESNLNIINKEFKILEKEHNIDENFIAEAKNLLSEYNRFPIFIQKDCKLNKELFSV